ncbi:MAG: hypothetical protein IJE73_08635 [Muribaculaceae bacterium]|nr:hypothetical protein [Muribaculaceae bacterium]
MKNKLVKILTVIAIVIGAMWLGRKIKYLFRRRVTIDRMLVQGKFTTVLRLLGAVLVLLGVFTVLLDVLGFDGSTLFSSNSENKDSGLLWSVVYHFADPGNQHMAQSGVARLIVLLLALSGCVILNGILVSAIIGWYERFVDKWRMGLARYDKLLEQCNFGVIIGGNEMVFDLIKQILGNESLDYIVLQTNQDVEALRKQLCSFLLPEEEKKVIIYYGERTSQDDIKDLHLDCAKMVYILGESLKRGCCETNSEQNHDALNMKCMQLIVNYLNDRSVVDSSKLICYVLFEYQTTFSIFQFSDINTPIIDFRPINYYEMWSQRVLVNENLKLEELNNDDYLPLEGKNPITHESDDFVHLVVVGMSKMGVAMAIEAAHIAHYPNFVRNQTCKTRITFIDKECDTEMLYFQGRFKSMFDLAMWRYVESKGNYELYKQSNEKGNKGGWENLNKFSENHYLGEDFIDVEWEFIKGGIETPEIRKYLEEASANSHARFTLAICLPQDYQSIAASLYLPNVVYENAIQILIYQRQSNSTIESISKDLIYGKIKAFGMLEKAYEHNLIKKMYAIADKLGKKYDEMYQEVTKEYEQEDKDSNKPVGQTEIKKRGKSAAAKMWSNIYNANTLWTKLRSVNSQDGTISENDIDKLARTEHNRWVVEQLLMRFRALTKEEQKQVVSGDLDKDKLKGEKMAHLDICSTDKLSEIDKIVTKYDKGFIKIITNIITEISNTQNIEDEKNE